MFFIKKYHTLFYSILVLIILNACQLQEPNKNHGILFLKNRSDQLQLNSSNIVKVNNVLMISFDKYGILKDKSFFDKNDLEKIAFSKEITENNLSTRSFAEKFLQSIKKKMYDK